MRNIEAGEPVLARRIQDVLGKSVGGSATEGAEDFADVIQVLAEGVAGAYGELFKQVGGPELRLHSVVIGEAGVIAAAHDAFVTVHAAESSAGARSDKLRSGARRYSSRNQVREIRGQRSDLGVGVQGLEQILTMIAGVAPFHGRVLGDFALKTETPAMDLVRAKVGRNGGFSEGARIKYTRSNGRGDRGANIGPRWNHRQRMRAGSRQILQEHLR